MPRKQRDVLIATRLADGLMAGRRWIWTCTRAFWPRIRCRMACSARWAAASSPTSSSVKSAATVIGTKRRTATCASHPVRAESVATPPHPVTVSSLSFSLSLSLSSIGRCRAIERDPQDDAGAIAVPERRRHGRHPAASHGERRSVQRQDALLENHAAEFKAVARLR